MSPTVPNILLLRSRSRFLLDKGKRDSWCDVKHNKLKVKARMGYFTKHQVSSHYVLVICLRYPWVSKQPVAFLICPAKASVATYHL